MADIGFFEQASILNAKTRPKSMDKKKNETWTKSRVDCGQKEE